MRKLYSCRRGATAAEYAIILAVIGSVVAVAALALGGAIGGSMDTSGDIIETCGGTC